MDRLLMMMLRRLMRMAMNRALRNPPGGRGRGRRGKKR